MDVKKTFGLFKSALTEWSEDKAPQLGAALAFYTLFSLAPLIMIAISVAGMVFGDEAARGEIVGSIRSLVGEQGAKTVEEIVQNASKNKKGGIAAGLLGIVTLIFGASGVFGQLKDALNTVWNVPPSKEKGIMKMIKDRFFSVTMVLGVIFLLLTSLVLSSALSAAGGFLSSNLPGGEALWQILNLVISFAAFTFVFALLFKYLPDVKLEWRDVWLGAAVTALLFVAGKFAIGIYLGKSSMSSTYGAAGSLVVLLVWIYYSAQILFFGAEFTQVYVRGPKTRDIQAPAAAAQPGLHDSSTGMISPAHDIRLVPAAASGRSPAPAAAKSSAAVPVATGLGGLLVGAIGGAVFTVVRLIKGVTKLAKRG